MADGDCGGGDIPSNHSVGPIGYYSCIPGNRMGLLILWDPEVFIILLSELQCLMG